MIILRSPATKDRLIAVFGVGLIGSATVDAMRVGSSLEADELPLSWTDGHKQDEQVGVVEKALAGDGQGNGRRLFDKKDSNRHRRQLDVLWSAGRAGFAANSQMTFNEYDSFRRILAMVERISRRAEDTVVSFHLISSAGGLYEGQRLVNKGSVPAPQRPYGELKREQEKLLLASNAPIAKRIYRLTSVYGYIRSLYRRGLIPTLVWNGISQRVSHIYGRPSTLRDFIWVEDVAQFLGRSILCGTAGSDDEITVLASAKPTAIREVQNIVERVINRQIYVSYSLDAPDSEDITFSSEVLPSSWYITDLLLTVRRIYEDALLGGVTYARVVN